MTQDRPSLGPRGERSPLRTGTLLALASALLFGASTPLLHRFGAGVGAFMTAALLYAGAACGSLTLRPRVRHAPFPRHHLPRLALVALLGAFLAPALLAWGLARTNAALGSLLLASEALFTTLLARALFREPFTARVGASLVLIGGGVAALVVGAGALSSRFASGAVIGAAAVTGAAFAWAVDNVLTRPLADLDPRQVVARKATLGAALSFLLARREPFPSVAASLGLLVTGALGFGVSLRLYLLAQRRIGAGRTGSVFAAAPVLGALLSTAVGDGAPSASLVAAGAMVAIGLYLHATEDHGHPHTHAALQHEHAHRHDDDHHDHVHEPAFTGEHTHPHAHASREHAHPHGPDLHHEHDHG